MSRNGNRLRGEARELFIKRELRKFGRQCPGCSEPIIKDHGAYYTQMSREPITIDHIVPLARGGKTASSNLMVMCRKCNLLKGTTKGWSWKRRQPVTDLRMELICTGQLTPRDPPE